ncbi:putative ABC transporter ATP-binding protein YbhF [Pelotomaculum sp. FP]|uniref:ABC transporter ATP-binding protein n=1 Tax=Pelotomaculum sp. FP TaxID=261474 RepID=UPI001066C845|nr:ABC transporter ATP-binding protein [Pelotomaculum sp. FP]TEB16385.1 putative ABC transporter ATP-binding protein YbhF [Pelotomaculum sp. FP]
MIETTGLTKVFGSLTAVDQVSIKIERGEIFGLVGPDGAGKTTLMRMLCNLITPTSGQIKLLDMDGKDARKAVESYGYMPQRFSLYGDLTVMENINFFGAMYNLDRRTIRSRADEILEMTNLIKFKTRLADNLSGGMKQKLALTCALVSRPGMLILDEPTYGVDPESRKDFWRVLYNLNREGMTILVSTAYMDEAELCQKVAFMDRGKIAAVDTPGSIKRRFPYKVLEIKAETRDLGFLNGLDVVRDAYFYGGKFHVLVDKDTPQAAVLAKIAGMNAGVVQVREVPPSIEDVFVLLAEKEVV